MTDARVPFRATMPVQIGPCRGGDSLLEVRVRPIALQGIVVWWSLPAVYDFLRGPKHQASGVFRGGLWKVWKTFLEAAGVVLKACSQATLIREDDGLRCEFGFACACIRSLVLLLLRWCSAHAQTGRVEFLVEASKAFLSSWFGLVHGVLRVAGNGPIETTDTAVIGERGWCLSVSGRARSTSQLLMEVRLKTSTAICRLCVTFRQRACWNSCLQLLAWWIVSLPTLAISHSLFGSWPSAEKGIATSGPLEKTVGFAD